MHFRSLLVLSLALTTLTAPTPKKKKQCKDKMCKEPNQIITFDLNDGDIHYPNGTTQKSDGTWIETDGTIRDSDIFYKANIPSYPGGDRACEKEIRYDQPLFDEQEWKKWCVPRMCISFLISFPAMWVDFGY